VVGCRVIFSCHQWQLTLLPSVLVCPMVMQMTAMGAVLLQCEVSCGSGGGSFFLSVATLVSGPLLGALRRIEGAP
jgi:nitrate/nitrite transporter NarK